MLFLLLEGEANASANTADPASQWVMWVLLGVVVIGLIVMMVVSSRRNKKRQEEADQLINAVKPGNKVKTIGGVCGIVVEVDNEENTFVLETGSEATGKCYMKFDKQAIYQTDAVVEKSEEETEKDKPAKDDEKEETPAEVSAQEPTPPAEDKE